jgi:hypothetical protein
MYSDVRGAGCTLKHSRSMFVEVCWRLSLRSLQMLQCSGMEVIKASLLSPSDELLIVRKRKPKHGARWKWLWVRWNEPFKAQLGPHSEASVCCPK